MSAIAVELGMSVGIGFGQTLLGNGLDLQGKLAKRTFVIVSSKTLERNLLARRHNGSLEWSVGVSRDCVEQRFRRSIAGSQRESVVQLARHARHIARSIELHGEIEMIIGVVRVRIDGFLKKVGGGSSV